MSFFPFIFRPPLLFFSSSFASSAVIYKDIRTFSYMHPQFIQCNVQPHFFLCEIQLAICEFKKQSVMKTMALHAQLLLLQLEFVIHSCAAPHICINSSECSTYRHFWTCCSFSLTKCTTHAEVPEQCTFPPSGPFSMCAFPFLYRSGHTQKCDGWAWA